MTGRCHYCRGEFEVSDRVGRRDECPHCKSDLRVCLNCAHYDPRAPDQCREERAEWVEDKDKANFCDYFAPRPAEGGRSGGTDKAAARERLERLFRKPGPGGG